MKIIILSFGIIFALFGNIYSQVNYSGKIETGYLLYNYRTVIVDPGPSWQGYNLKEDQNGINLNIINGVKFGKRFYTGLGVGYLNFTGTSGISFFGDLEIIILKTKLSPIINSKIGYSHIWNQYENGTGTGMIELVAGINYKLITNISLFIKTGIAGTQQVSFIPIEVGVRF